LIWRDFRRERTQNQQIYPIFVGFAIKLDFAMAGMGGAVWPNYNKFPLTL